MHWISRLFCLKDNNLKRTKSGYFYYWEKLIVKCSVLSLAIFRLVSCWSPILSTWIRFLKADLWSSISLESEILDMRRTNFDLGKVITRSNGLFQSYRNMFLLKCVFFFKRVTCFFVCDQLLFLEAGNLRNHISMCFVNYSESSWRLSISAISKIKN